MEDHTNNHPIERHDTVVVFVMYDYYYKRQEQLSFKGESVWL